MPTAKVIQVPDVPAPRKYLCWKRSPALAYCDRVHSHGGLHSWELHTALQQRTEEVERLREDLVMIASPGSIEDYGNGWAVERARRALAETGRERDSMKKEYQLSIICVDGAMESIQSPDRARVLQFMLARDHEGSSLTLCVRDTPESPVREITDPEAVYRELGGE